MSTILTQIFPSIIPYVKEIRPVAGSLSGTILWQQLEYRFKNYPTGFYKFLSIPKTHHDKYRKGDSWTEELAFSIKEFRSAFDNIGVRYPTKSSYQTKENPFLRDDGSTAYFCSYYDKITHVTHYFRNHEGIKSLYTTLNLSGDKPRDALLDSTELPKVPLPSEPNDSSTIYTKKTSIEKHHNRSTPPENLAVADDNQAPILDELVISTKTENTSNTSEAVVVSEQTEPTEQLAHNPEHWRFLSEREKQSAELMLAAIQLSDQKDVMTVLHHAHKTNKVRSLLGYLKTLVMAVLNKTFRPLSAKAIQAVQVMDRPLKTPEPVKCRFENDNDGHFADLKRRYGRTGLEGVKNPYRLKA